MGHYSDQWDWDECDWCRAKGNWRRRPCLLRMSETQGMLRAKREACERVRMENAAKRNKTLPKVYRRAMKAAVAEAKDNEVRNSSIRTDQDTDSVVNELRIPQLGERTPVEALPAGLSKSTPKPKHHEVDVKKTQQRQAKICTGPKDMIDEGLSLASDDGDVARIHDANRKAWPRGQEPIAADATTEDREVAELVRRGLIAADDLQVDRDDLGGDLCLYTVRFVEARKKGKRGNSRWRQGVQVAEPTLLDAESDWWYLDDEDWSDAKSGDSDPWISRRWL